jgi:hypothetical protein
MKSFIYCDTEYRSLRQACDSLRISYLRVKRLCRHYVRAHRDPTLAIEWIITDTKIPKSEPKTAKYYHDQKLTNERVAKFRERIKTSIINKLLSEV